MAASEEAKTIAEMLRGRFDDLTRAERQLADIILENYPVSGLGSITTIAENAQVSTPTVARMVQKLGFKGFPEFQSTLRQELEAKISNPIAKRDTWVERAPDRHVLNRFTEAVIGNIEKSLAQIDPATFDATAALLADTSKRVFVVGGRITRVLSDYLFLHLQVIREGVTHVEAISNAWPHYLLDVEEGDAVVVFDMRRYETSTLRLAEMAHERGARIVLFTDQWQSPVHRYAEHSFAGRIEVPSAWDSTITLMLLTETLIAAVQEANWQETRRRMEDLEVMFDRTKFFRKFT